MPHDKSKEAEYPILPPEEDPRRSRGDYIDLPDGSHIAPNGAVIEEPMSSVPELAPPNRFTPDKQDLDLLIL